MAIYLPIVTQFNDKGLKAAKQGFSDLEGAQAKAKYALGKANKYAAVALGGLVAGLGDAVKGAMEDAAAQKVLAGNLRNSAKATDAQIKSTEAMITKMSMATGVADDELRPAFSKLILATKDIERSTKLMAVAQDIAAATGKPLESVTQALAKAEMGQYAALKKLGIPMSEGIQASIDLQKEQKKLAKIESEVALVKFQIAEGMLSGSEASKKLTDANGKLAAQSAIVNDLMASTGDYADDVAKTFGGAASDAANTAAGSMKRLGVALGEAKEGIGAALLPILEKALPVLQSFATWAQENPTLITAVAVAFGALAASIVLVNAAMALNPAVLITAGIVALGVALVVAYKKFDTFRAVVNAVVNQVARNFEFMANAFITMINVVIKGINLIKPGKDIGTLGEVSLGRLGGGNSAAGGANPAGLDYKAMATGGIVTSPTMALIGEAGPEAVIPLSRAGGLGMGSVTINVNGGDPNAVVLALQNYVRTNGPVPITTRAM